MVKSLLCKLFKCGSGKGRVVLFNYKLGLVEPKTKTTPMLDIKLTNEQKIKVTLSPVTGTGKPAELDGEPSVSVVSGEATIERIEGSPREFYVVSSDSPGQSEILIEADADLGEGVETISDVIRLTVEGARAVALGLRVGEPEAK